MTSGDRLLLLSDGLSECENKDGNMLEAEGVADMAISHNQRSAEEIPQDILQHVIEFAGKSTFDDDVSLLSLDFGRES
jgi:sigma-B regulation protein RsbU (phosphoserine phosphatase)